MNASPLRRPAPLAAVLAALVLLPCSAAAQWVLQSPIPHGNTVYDVGTPSAGVAFIGGVDSEWDDPRGPLFRTTNSGETWADVPFPNQFELRDVFFLDAQRGWAVGDVNWRTTDGGQTWQRLPFLGSAYFVEFYTPTFGYTSGNFGRMTTRNGGQSWQFSPGQSYAFSFRDDQVGLAAAASGIRRTTDGGQTWTLVRSGRTEDVQFLSVAVAVAIAGDRFLRSEDGGLTWTNEDAAQGRLELLRVSDAVALALVTADFPGEGRLLRTDDGGQSWDDLGNVIPDGVYRIERLDDQTVVALTPHGHVWRSADAGLTWTMTLDAPAVFSNALGMDFADPLNGYIAGGGGLVLETRDGGVTWRQISNGYGAATDIDRFDDRRLLVSSDDPLLTEDGGATWVLIEDGTENELTLGYFAVQVVNDAFAVMLARSTRVGKTFDGGHTWVVTNPVPYPPFDVENGDLHFRSPQDGWQVGLDLQPPYNRNVWHTTDGGQTWVVPPALPNTGGDTFVAIDFEGDRGWILSGLIRFFGANAAYLRTENGGATWVYDELPNSGSRSMNDIEFFDENTGYAVGELGYAARSTDGGHSWTILNVPDPPPGPYSEYVMTDLYLTSPTDVWVSTIQDVVLHSDNGGTTWEELVINSRPEAFDSFVGVTATEEGSAWVAGFGGHIYALNPPALPAVTVLAQPVNPPVVVGAGGGAFDFTVTLANTTNQPQTVQAWTSVTGPVSISPVLGPQTVTLPAGGTASRTLTQVVPANAPAGTYTYTANVQLFQGSILDRSGFVVVKQAGRGREALAAGNASPAGAAGWTVSGWASAVTASTALPEGFALSEAYPNPFDATARLTLEVAEPQRVEAALYDGLGRRVAVLHSGEVKAGAHVLVLDGAGLPAGVYVVRVTGETFSVTRRVTLLR